VGLSPLSTAATSGLLYKLQMIDEGDCGATGRMKIGRGNRSTRRKPAPVALCPPQIPHDQTRARTRASTVGSQRLTALAMARPSSHSYLNIVFSSQFPDNHDQCFSLQGEETLEPLTRWSNFLFGKLIVTQLVNIFPISVDAEALLSCPQEPTTGSWKNTCKTSRPIAVSLSCSVAWTSLVFPCGSSFPAFLGKFVCTLTSSLKMLLDALFNNSSNVTPI
jgi:hypothetical protein